VGTAGQASLSRRGEVPVRPAAEVSLEDLRQDVGFAEDLDLLPFHLDLSARILAEEHLIAFDNANRRALARVQQLAGTHCQNLATPLLFLCRIRKHDATGRLLLGLDLLNHDAVLEGAYLLLGHEVESLFCSVLCPESVLTISLRLVGRARAARMRVCL